VGRGLAALPTLRRWLLWAHLFSGAVAGLFILFFAITGSLLAYERPILAHADNSYKVHPGPERLSISELLHRAPFQVTAVTVLAKLDAPILFTVGRRDLYMVDPHTGSILGIPSPRLRRFFLTVTSLHRWFGLEANHRQVAAAVKGLAVLVFLFLLLSGALLWLPSRLTSSTLRIRSRFMKRSTWRARAWNWHHVAGLWTGLPLLFIVVTGIIMAYPWANALLFRVAGTPVPPRTEVGQPRAANHVPRAHRGSDGSRGRKGLQQPDLDSAFAAVAAGHPGWRTIAVRLEPDNEKNSLTFTVDDADGGRPAAKTQVVATMAEGSRLTLRELPFTSQPKGQRWRAWVRFTHTGEAAGWLGEAIALVSAVGACILALTGLQMFCQRLLRARFWKGEKSKPGINAVRTIE
jgi:uncharacterized iron-regulated membrane protein